jgi:DtxR family Mn-dependent transcriptional regulator
MYLRTILELEEEGQIALRARIAERLEQSGPTVSQTIARMERDGLVVVSGDRHLELTNHGRKNAVAVMRKHRLAERLLADVIGLEWEFVHDEACRWEHVISEQVERKIIGLISTPDVSPYGNPIPGLEELGLEMNPTFKDGVVSLNELPKAIANQSTYILRRIGEPLQVDSELLVQLRTLGLMPGVQINIEFSAAGVLITKVGADEGLSLTEDLALHLYVEG